LQNSRDKCFFRLACLHMLQLWFLMRALFPCDLKSLLARLYCSDGT
jgi:hypothetical protein